MQVEKERTREEYQDPAHTDPAQQDRARQEFFNRRAAGWLDNFYKNPETGNHDLHREKIWAIVGRLAPEPGHRILDLGCGSGVMVPYLLERLGPEGRLAEMDYAREMIDANRALHRDGRISFECTHVMDMPFGAAAFDRVICFACFPHFQDQAGAVERIAKVLKPGGRLVIAHLMSSQEIAGHHRGHTPVSRDQLPPLHCLAGWLADQGLKISDFTDRPGFYCLAAVKGPDGP
ncbi:MAG: methyltransferase domain-containing protein [Desulfobacter sp.]|nr:MAG: methyltransferase domain-containing protein [Desulfobacter sp.]